MQLQFDFLLFQDNITQINFAISRETSMHLSKPNSEIGFVFCVDYHTQQKQTKQKCKYQKCKCSVLLHSSEH